MFVNGFLRGALALVFTLATGVSEAKPIDELTDVELQVRLDHLQHELWADKAVEQDDGWFSGCRKSKVQIKMVDPISRQTREFGFLQIRPDTPKPVAISIVIPTMDGVTSVERTIASKLCSLGIAAIVAEVNQNQVPEQIPSWGFEDRTNRRAILTLRTLIDYIQVTPYFDARKIAMIGSSLGGVTTSFMAGIEPERIAAFVTVVGGGNIPFTLSVSDNDKVGELRDLRMRHEGFQTAEQYEDKLRSSMRFDPMHFARRAVREKIFMALSRSDTKVPTQVQQDLFEAFKKPENTVFNVGHAQTVIGMAYFYFDYVASFLTKRLGLPAKKGQWSLPTDLPPLPSLPTDLLPSGYDAR